MYKSADPEDRANAEAPRLAAAVWGALGRDLAERRAAQIASLHSASWGGPGFGPGAPAGPEEIDVAAYPARLESLWRRYVSTFEILDEGSIAVVGDIPAAASPALLPESLRDYVHARGIAPYVAEMKKLLRIEDEGAIPAGLPGCDRAPEPPGYTYEPMASPRTPAGEPVRAGGRTRAMAAAQAGR